MKKLSILVALLVLVSMCSVILASCDNNGDTSTPVSAGESAPVSTPAESDDTSAASSEAESEEESIPEPPVVVYAPQDVEIDTSLTKTLKTQGCTYTCPDSTRDEGDGWRDDEKTKLTDGVINSADGSVTSFFGTSASGTIDVVVDLGEKISGLAEFAFYATSGNWGISAPTSVQYFVSDDGETWLPVADAIFTTEIEMFDTVDPWVQYNYQLTLEKGVSGRYVKFSVENEGHIWIGEVCAYTYE